MSQTDLVAIDVVLKARVDDSQVSQTGGDEPQDLAQDLLKDEDEQKQILREEAFERFDDFLKNLDQQGLKNLRGVVTNPSGLVQNELLGLLSRAGIYGAVATAIVGIVLESPEVIAKVIEVLGQKGGPLNQDYTRKLAEENQLGISRDLQFRRAVGADIIITVEDRNYIITDPGFINNSLVDVERTRSIRINSNQTQYGYATGI